ncbi:MAG: HupE/UreJ family protein [Betaproteobacteria bacterium]|nr:HupE/UreJ family protein [Betaproteobacteria bacterium]
MKRRSSISVAAPITLLFMVPTLAWAHVGADVGISHGTAFIAGFLHPFTGMDHLLAMLVVGLWSALATRRIWAVPLVFACMLLLGAVFGLAGLALPTVEPMLAASLLVLGLLLATRAHLPTGLALGLIGGFAIFHGIAHGTELPSAQAFATLSGMMLTTVGLHISGLLAGHYFLARSVWLPRVIGAGIATLGAGLLTGLV